MSREGAEFAERKKVNYVFIPLTLNPAHPEPVEGSKGSGFCTYAKKDSRALRPLRQAQGERIQGERNRIESRVACFTVDTSGRNTSISVHVVIA